MFSQSGSHICIKTVYINGLIKNIMVIESIHVLKCFNVLLKDLVASFQFRKSTKNEW